MPDVQLSFKSPVTSRAATPVGGRFKPRFAYQDSLELSASRSQSRARPGRRVELPLADSVHRQGSTNGPDGPKIFVHGPSQAKYEKDAFKDDGSGDETSENARVWHIYNDEANKADALMADGWSRSIDVLLVFVS
ncbi:hypothetical protein R3P38DRAFT_1716561 [Favolaschia claudopus]|uniref:DUF6535 domain-containing protein n=1 Tax=Favolaschia claudopus TaxID=2862362 RepID=A0AAW0AAY4_9AGAR